MNSKSYVPIFARSSSFDHFFQCLLKQQRKARKSKALGLTGPELSSRHCFILAIWSQDKGNNRAVPQFPHMVIRSNGYHVVSRIQWNYERAYRLHGPWNLVGAQQLLVESFCNKMWLKIPCLLSRGFKGEANRVQKESSAQSDCHWFKMSLVLWSLSVVAFQTLISLQIVEIFHLPY